MKNAICWDTFCYGTFLLAIGNCPVTQVMLIKKTLPEVLLLSHGICVADKQENVCSAFCCKAIVKQ